MSPQQDNDSMSDINITPFVDVLLVLLIIFMVTAPIVNHVIQVDLPKDKYQEDKHKLLDSPLRLVIDQAGVLYVGEEKIGKVEQTDFEETLTKKIRLWANDQQNPVVDLEADQNIRYGLVVPVIARLKEMNVGLNLVIVPLASPQ
ncbi:MAG: biopolymer transporter ExbD [SAR324 cluster bacterium]|nr:biopolymer transporter ExbD [SAR324 cluster bacterium]MBF0353325.1 biopolymer transporter ExbD [SAR324 cluster bacterium]